VRGLVAERERNGAYRDLADLASRSAMGREGLERLAWAGACAPLGIAGGKGLRRDELWRLGIARGSERMRGRNHAQLALPLPLPAPPEQRPLDSWERIVADYSSTGVTLGEHPLEVMRSELSDVVRTDELPNWRDGADITVTGMVVARQRPATAKGIVFMLLEDEAGVVNVIVPPPVYERCRLAVRTASFASVAGKLERREGVVNLVARSVERLAVPVAGTGGEVRTIEPPAERETGRSETEELPAVAAAGGGATREIAVVAPKPHSFGRRG
jgi:error-prone DNA polymerase